MTETNSAPPLDGPAFRGKLRAALDNLASATSFTRLAILDSDDRDAAVRQVLAAEEFLQLALNDLTGAMTLATPAERTEHVE